MFHTHVLSWKIWNVFSRIQDHKKFFMDAFCRHVNLKNNEVKILLALDNREKMHIQKLAERVQIDPGNLSREVEKMAKKKLLSKSADRFDKRIICLKLTPAGSRIVSDFENLLINHLSNFYKNKKSKEVIDVLLALEDLESFLQEERTLLKRVRNTKKAKRGSKRSKLVARKVKSI